LFRHASWIFVLLFGVSLAGATFMNITLISQARKALEVGILGNKPAERVYAYHVALVIPDTPDSFFDGLIEGVLEAAPKADVAVQIFRYNASGTSDSETYFQLCLSSRLDGIILYSGVDEQVAARKAQAEAEGIVFIPVGTRAPQGDGEVFIGSSSLLQGIESGNKLTQKYGRAARVGIILSSDGEENPKDDPMYRGVMVTLQSYPGARIVMASRARPGILSGEEAASAILRSEPSINVLVCASAPITEGAAQVVVDQGRVGQLLIIGTDESPAIDKLIDKGVIAASIVRDSHRMGAEALTAFAKARSGVPLRHAQEVGFTIREKKEVRR